MATLDLHPQNLDFPRPALENPEEALNRSLRALDRALLPPPGAAVALLAGSRRIANLPAILKALADHLKALGLKPFVVPAMGSHGGATPDGQREVLASLGITTRTIGAPVISSGGVSLAGRTASGFEVWADSAALAAEALIPVNRVKPHTAFRGAVESGPSKMLAVGLGKERSAGIMHRAGLSAAIPEATEVLLATGRVPLGVALLENHLGETALAELLTRPNWLAEEAKLLEKAWELYPRLPWAELDLLIVERMGKDISGTGMDINVIGLARRFPESAALPRIRRVVALSLTPGSLGNGTGVGYADIITRELADAIDVEKTKFNCRVSGFPEAARIPRIAENEEKALEMALAEVGNPAGLRAVRIRDTANLAELLVSRALLDDRGGPVNNSYGKPVDNPVSNRKSL